MPEPTTAALVEQQLLAALATLSERLEAADLRHTQDEKIILKRGQEIDRQLRRAEAAEQERDAYKKAKAENDERFMLRAEAAEARVQELEGALREIAGPTPTSHRKTVDQLTDAVKWRQGIARDVLARAALEPPEPTA